MDMYRMMPRLMDHHTTYTRTISLPTTGTTTTTTKSPFIKSSSPNSTRKVGITAQLT